MEIKLRFVKTTKKYQHYEIVGSDAVGHVYIQIERLALPPTELSAEVGLTDTAGVAR